MHIIPLNILFDYPIYWSKYKVFRDFVQNFYDSKPMREWHKSFFHTYDSQKKQLIFGVNDSGFSYDWLLHIGASSKTNSFDNAGFFGEGFKIAMLSAMKKYHWDITMCSRDWKIHGIAQEIQIDGIQKKALAYEIMEVPMQNDSSLIMCGIEQNDYDIFTAVLLSFLYPENALLGKCLYEDEYVALYMRSDIPVPDELPCTPEFGNKGVVFARYQAMGTLPLPLGVAYHRWAQEDRERKTLRNYDVLKLLYTVAGCLSPESARIVLGMASRYWNSYPEQLVDIHTWYYVICTLIKRVALSEKESRKFREEYPNLLYVKRFTENNHEINRRRGAKAWLKNYPKKYKIVQELFKLLGYEQLEDVCEAAGGYANKEDPTALEKQYLDVLDELAKNEFADFFPQQDMPIRILRENQGGYVGLAETKKIRNGKTNCYGLKVKNELYKIAIEERYLKKDNFANAIATYLHERSHTFGGDSYSQFGFAMTKVIEILANQPEILSKYKAKWDAIEGDQEEYHSK